MRQLTCPQPIPSIQSLNGGLPLSFDEVCQLAHVVEIPFEVSSLGAFGMHLGSSRVTTRNEGSSLQGRSGYDWTASARKVSIRAHESDRARIFYTSGDSQNGLPSCLFVAAQDGVIGHWIDVSEEDATSLLVGIDTTKSSSWEASLKTQVQEKVIPLQPIRELLSRWHENDLGKHLDSMIQDRGRSRRRSLKSLDKEQACQTSRSYVEKLLGYLCHRKLHFCFSVPACGVLQTACSAGIDLRIVGSRLICEMASDTFTLDLDLVASAWITRHLTWANGPTGGCGGSTINRFCSAIELYDKEGRSIAMLHSSPWAPEAEWNRLVDVLPRL